MNEFLSYIEVIKISIHFLFEKIYCIRFLQCKHISRIVNYKMLIFSVKNGQNFVDMI